VFRSARSSTLAALLLAASLAVSACGGGGSTSGSNATKPVTITITEKNGKISPDDGHIVTVDKGQQVQIVVTTDAADEIHVHSIPEHEFEVKAGVHGDLLPAFSISTPGRFVIESHGLNVTLVTLQVS
jgi:hypothetical protein